MTKKPAVYDIDAYTDAGTLKIALTLWLVMAYLGRHLLFIAIGGLSTFAGRKFSASAIDYSPLFSNETLLLASLPAIFLIVVAFCRVPSAGAAARTIWRNGRSILVASVILDLLIAWMISPKQLQAIGALQVAFVILDVYVLIYLFRSTRVRDTFADFPTPLPDR